MSDYTPLTESVQSRWSVGCLDGIAKGRAEFDRWLVAHAREVAAKALRDAAGDLAEYETSPTPTFDAMVVSWLNRRADEIGVAQ